MDRPLIKVLPPDLINKIAAGEVVERPASVVKELVENSIDAKSKRIVVDIFDAGKKLIKVVDDGVGMSKDEIALSLKRHSTSKITSIDDLFNIKTLGFRGEALPSIDSVSKMKIEKNPSGAGLSVEVCDLFYNVPARLKFLKSNYTEIGHIQDLVVRFILGNPEISFKLIIDGREVFFSPGNRKLFDAVFSVYGIDLAKELIEISSENIKGYVSSPVLSRVDRSFETFFVNGRVVQNFLLSRALEDAYKNLIPAQRHPVAVLFLDLPPSDIDVNVHPSKKEIKFLKTKEVLDAVRDSVRSVLQKYGEAFKDENGGASFPNQSYPQNTEMMLSGDSFPDFNPPENLLSFEVSGVLPVVPIFQFLDTYIICTDGEDLVLIDQHAAHERIIFDKLQNKKEGISTQNLLIPENLELNPQEYLFIEKHLEDFKGFGFDMENFGKNSILVRGIPSFLGDLPIKKTVEDIVDEFKNENFAKQPEKIKDRMNKFIACRGAVKAGKKLSPAEINSLIRDLYETENPSTCPHGRPVIVRLSKDTIEKMFKRKGF